MASTWGDSWGVSWSFSWDILDGPEPEVVTVGGRRWVPTQDEIDRDKKNKSNFPYKHLFPDSREKRIHQSAEILARSGGYARAKNLTPSERTKIATHAAKTRWK